MKNYNAKNEIMKIFSKHPQHDFDTDKVFRAAQYYNLFLPSAINTHLSQLCKAGKITRTARATYKLTPTQNV